MESGLFRDEDGTWRWKSPPPDTMNADYARVLPIYFTAYDRLFIAAKKRSQFDFIAAIVHYDENSNQDPFETTKKMFREVLKLHDNADGYAADVLPPKLGFVHRRFLEAEFLLRNPS